MLLNDRMIRRLGKRGMIQPFCEELIEPGVISYGPSSYGYDLRTSDEFKIFTNLSAGYIDPKDFKPDNLVTATLHEDVKGRFILLPPNSFALAVSMEYLKLPRWVTGTVFKKSTYARSGISCPPTVLEAGWEGQVTLEIINNAPLPVRVYAGEGIVQVLFFSGEAPEMSYKDRKGKYQGQRGVTLPKVRSKENV